MNRTTISLLLAAAAWMGTSVAQAQTLKAEIPFAFQAGSKMMPAGTYTVTARDAEKTFLIRNTQSFESVLVLPQGGRDPERSWTASGNGVLLFACAEGCALERIWTNTGYPVHSFAAPKSQGRYSHLSVIRLESDKARVR